MKVLLYIRPKSRDFMEIVANGLFNNPEIVTYSDYNHISEVWAGKYIYNGRYDLVNEQFEKLKDDIIPRCRTLRKMPQDLSYKLARRYWNGMEEFFSEEKFDYLITTPIDCYSLDIICRIAQKHQVNIVSFVGSAFANHAWVTLRGEYNKVRDYVPEEEITYFVDKMTKVQYLSPTESRNIKQTHSSIYKYHIRRTLIERFYYPLMKFKDKDPWNYHYNIFEVKDVPLTKRYNSSFDSLFEHIDDLNIDPKATVYYPMHLIPEATTDYWCPINVVNYNQYVIDMIRSADKGITFIIKEHPAMYGRRVISFYEMLRKIPNVVLLHPMDRSNSLLQIVDNIVVDNGTVGIEALLRGKRVLTVCDNYYWKLHPNAFKINCVTWESLNIPLVEYDNQLFMRDLLQSCFESDFTNSMNGIPKSNPQQVIEGLKRYLVTNGLPY